MAKIDELVLTIGQMNLLKESGVEVKDTALAWVKSNKGEYFVAPVSLIFHDDYIPTLTLQEAIDLLPEEITKNGKTYSFYCIYPSDNACEVGYSLGFDRDAEVIYAGNLFMAVFRLLRRCAEKGYLKEE